MARPKRSNTLTIVAFLILVLLGFVLFSNSFNNFYNFDFNDKNIDKNLENIPLIDSQKIEIPFESENQNSTSVNVFVNKNNNSIQVSGIRISSDSISQITACTGGVCLIEFEYKTNNLDTNLQIISQDFNILNKQFFEVKDSTILTLAVTQEPILKNCIFSYAKNDNVYVSNYWATFKRVCFSLDKLASVSGLTIHPNYAIVWNSQTDSGGEYFGSDIIYLSQEYPFNLSQTMLHEITHSLTGEANFPNWINEGLAEYYSYKSLDRFHKKTGYLQGLETWNNDLGVQPDYYESAHTAIQNFAEEYGDEKLRKLVKYFIDYPEYSAGSEIVSYNTRILSKMREITSDDSLTSVKYLANLHLKKP